MKKFIIILLCTFLLTGCSKGISPVIRTDIFNVGLDYVKLMQQNVNQNNESSIRQVDSLAEKYTDIATNKYDYNQFTKEEKEFTDDLGNLRIAFDKAVFNQTPDIDKKITEESLNDFNHLLQKFEDKYNFGNK